MKNNLVISEKFISIQGEGQTMGVPAIFVRLAGCNLLCKSSSWVCDSIEVWQKGLPEAFPDVLSAEWVDALRNGTHLIFTGGEPLLHQNKITAYLRWFFGQYNFMPIIEVETNGTIAPDSYLLEFVDIWNCSPKLSDSGEAAERRVKPEAIKAIRSAKGSVMFKLVIHSEESVNSFSKDYGHLIPLRQVIFMPAGATQEELEKTRLLTVNLAMRCGVRYSDRLHIVIWDKKTGV